MMLIITDVYKYLLKFTNLQRQAKKSALADYWLNIKHSLHSEKQRLGRCSNIYYYVIVI
jgi:hypothetical protein